MRLILILLLLAGGPAFALTDSSATVTGTAANVLSAASGSTPRRAIHIVNRSSDTIWCSWVGTATVAGTGTFPLLGQGSTIIYGPPGVVPQDALSCISAGTSSPLTVLVVP